MLVYNDTLRRGTAAGPPTRTSGGGRPPEAPLFYREIPYS